MEVGYTRRKLLIVLLLLVAGTVDGRAGVIAYWGFDDSGPSVTREERGGRDGILVGNPRRVDGRVGRALRFDGDDDYVRVRHDPSFNIRDNITVAAWIKTERFEKVFATIIAKGDGAWRIARDTSQNVLQFAANSGSDLWVVRGSKNVNDGKWHHIVAVFDGVRARLYVDGVLDASLPVTRRINTSRFDVCLGENAERTGRHWKGLIDEVLILDHALSDSEVEELYVKGARALVSDELGALSGAIGEAQRLLAERGAKALVAVLRKKLEGGERGAMGIPPQAGATYRMVVSELYSLLAEAQAATGARQADIAQSCRKAVVVSLQSRRQVPALLWLFAHVGADEYADIVGESVRSSKDPCRDIHLIAERFGESADWAAFEAFLDAAVPHVPDRIAFANEVGEGLAERTAWAEAFVRYCRSRPQLKPYYISTRARLGQDAMARHDYSGAAEIYHSILAECDSEEDTNLYQIRVCECLFHDGRYRQALARIDQLIVERGTSSRPEVRQAQLLKGRAHMQLDELDQAAAVFSRLAATEPPDDITPEAAFLLGYCHMRHKDLEQASRTFAAVAEEYAASPFAGKARLGLKRVERMRQ